MRFRWTMISFALYLVTVLKYITSCLHIRVLADPLKIDENEHVIVDVYEWGTGSAVFRISSVSRLKLLRRLLGCSYRRTIREPSTCTT